MALNFETVGEGRRLVMAHGFTQNGRCWGKFGDLLAANHELALVDLPGHGHSEHDDANIERSAELLLEVGGDAFYLGYSMGGRIALRAAVLDPGRVKGLVLIGATAGIDDAKARLARRQSDDKLADRLVGQGLSIFLQRWLEHPMFANLSPNSACLSERLTNRFEGLAASLRLRGTGQQEPFWNQLSSLDMPVLVVAGVRDEKFYELGKRIVSAIGGNANLAGFDCGHAVHLEVAELVSEKVAGFTYECEISD